MTRRKILLVLGILATLSAAAWEVLVTNSVNNPDSRQNRAASKMNYGRFLDYVEKGWIKKVDFYNNGRIAIVEALSPELGDRPQRIRVAIPVGASPLIVKLREANVDIAAHVTPNYDWIFTLLSNLIVPTLVLVGLFFLFRNSSNFLGGFGDPGQVMGLRKSQAKVQLDADTGVVFADVAGIDEAKEEFQEVVTFLQKPQLFTAVGAKIPKGVILVGPPGTGKTLLAKAIAGEAGVPFISISGSEFVEMFVGIGASRVRDLFKTAVQNSPCIVFIDEIDAVGRQRGSGVGGSNDEREQTLNQLLTEMDGFQTNNGIIIIAATNRPDVLDGALLRPGRFDRQVSINLPDKEGRVAILNVHARNKKLSPEISLEGLAARTTGFSGADLANVLNEAAIVAARRKKQVITKSELDTAIDRVIAGLEGVSLTDKKNKRLIAYHEIGHAVAGTLLKNHDIVEKVTLIPRGQARGLTWFMPGEEMLISRAQLSTRIIGLLAGRAAENIVFGKGEITTGASNDIQQATKLARQMVTRFGMSTVGPIALSTPSQPMFLGLGRGLPTSRDFSDKVANHVDSQVQLILKHGLCQAEKIMKENRVIIDYLVDVLIEKETINGKDLENYVGMFTKVPTFGSIDEDKTFYLKQRGITTEETVRLINQ
jgi:cell division protease FtsH